jgi:malate dehydrogenase
MVKVAIVGTGRVGQGVAYTLMFEKYIDKLILVDTAPTVSAMVREELDHARAAHGFDLEIQYHNHSKFIKNADLIVVAAGLPRKAGMTRRDLAAENAKVIEDIVKNSSDKNPDAWYFIITNPVDAMTTLANKLVSGRRKIIGTGTNLETSRFRIILSRELNVPIRLTEGFVGGEHGDAAVPLWSTVRIDGMELNDYLENEKKSINKEKVFSYIKNVSMDVIKSLGGTRWGPAGSFLEIIRGILLNTGKLASYAKLMEFKELPEPVYVTVPGKISRSLNNDLWDKLWVDEQKEIINSAKAIFNTYQVAYNALKK